MLDALGSPQSLLLLGGNSDIGLATARRLVDDRCKLVILAVREPERASEAAEELRTRGAEVEVVRFDATETASHGKLMGDLFERHADIDLAILAFGVLGDQAEFDDDPELAASAVTTNYTGAVSSGLAVAAQMREQGHGTIVFLSSVAAERARSSNFVYGSSKAGMDAFAQGLSDSLASSGIHVMIVRPGFVASRMTEGMKSQPFSTTPEAVAEAVTTGLTRRSRTIWVPGILRYVFMTMRHLPVPLWRIVSARA